MSRIKYSWKEIVETNQIIKTNITKSNPPHAFVMAKGSAYCVLHRKFVEYVVRDPKANDLLKWGQDTFSPDEWFLKIY